jgi:predicted dehydrogenase
MAASYEECLQINRVSQETGVPCFVAYYRRTLPYFLRVKQLIDNGLLGRYLRCRSASPFLPIGGLQPGNSALAGEKRYCRSRVFL